MDEAVVRREIIASRLRLARESSGLSQGQVARHLGYHRPTISELEAGRRRIAAEELPRFAALYEVSLSWLVGEDEEQVDPERDRIQLAARELSRMNAEDLERVLRLLTALRQNQEPR